MTAGLDYSMRVLIALRAGPTDPYVLSERFGANYSTALSTLRRNGFVVDKANGEVSITELGRIHCPTRRAQKVAA